MLHSCNLCPGRSQLYKAFKKMFNDNNFDVDDNIKCEQCIHTNATKLVGIKLLVSEVINVFLENFNLLH